jgi:hypothetical protein
LATTNFGYNSNPCQTNADITKYNFTGNQYNTNIIAQKEKGVKLTLDETKRAEVIYPNPASTNIYVSLESNKIRNVKITDVTGRVFEVLFKFVNERTIEIDVSKLPNGSYFVTLENEEVKKSFKFVVLK